MTYIHASLGNLILKRGTRKSAGGIRGISEDNQILKNEAGNLGIVYDSRDTYDKPGEK